MKRIVICMGIIGIFRMFCSYAQETIQKELFVDHINTKNRIVIGETIDSIIQKFGNPTKTTKIESTDRNIYEWKNGLKLFCNTSKIYAIVINTKAFITSNGLVIGDTLKRLLSIIGDKLNVYDGWADYDTDQYGWIMQFKLKNEKITEIYVGPAD